MHFAHDELQGEHLFPFEMSLKVLSGHVETHLFVFVSRNSVPLQVKQFSIVEPLHVVQVV